MIKELATDDPLLKYPTFYNAYPIRNEISGSGARLSVDATSCPSLFIDDSYGRVFDEKSRALAPKYGLTSRMPLYVEFPSLRVVDEFRVPYRRVPVYEADSLDVISEVHQELTRTNGDHAMLLRGQSRSYQIPRAPQESTLLYGQEQANEPSFLPSHLRNAFDPYFLKCMWQSQAALLLRSVGHGIYKGVGPEAGKKDLQELSEFTSSPALMLFALGIAQHYGLPSLGLDLTDRLDVACWFATRTITTDSSGKATIALAPFTADRTPTVFIFRCPKESVFQYARAKPDAMPACRPDKQGAWFGHVGWGSATNQLGSYLACAFRLTKSIQEQLDPRLANELFPSPEDDRALDFFLRMRNAKKYEGEAARALKGVYYT